MDCSEEGLKSKTLAVFKNVITKDKPKKRKAFKLNTHSDEEISDSELVIDDEVKEEVYVIYYFCFSLFVFDNFSRLKEKSMVLEFHLEKNL